MGLWEIAIVAYVAVMVFALIMTRREQLQTRQTSLVFNTIGFAICTIWPLAMAGFLAARALRLA